MPSKQPSAAPPRPGEGLEALPSTAGSPALPGSTPAEPRRASADSPQALHLSEVGSPPPASPRAVSAATQRNAADMKRELAAAESEGSMPGLAAGEPPAGARLVRGARRGPTWRRKRSIAQPPGRPLAGPRPVLVPDGPGQTEPGRQARSFSARHSARIARLGAPHARDGDGTSAAAPEAPALPAIAPMSSRPIRSTIPPAKATIVDPLAPPPGGIYWGVTSNSALIARNTEGIVPIQLVEPPLKNTMPPNRNALRADEPPRTKKKSKYTPEQDRLILRLKAEGHSWADIARLSNCEKTLSARNRYQVLIGQQGAGGYTWRDGEVRMLQDLLDEAERHKWLFIANEMTLRRGRKFTMAMVHYKISEMFCQNPGVFGVHRSFDKNEGGRPIPREEYDEEPFEDDEDDEDADGAPQAQSAAAAAPAETA